MRFTVFFIVTTPLWVTVHGKVEPGMPSICGKRSKPQMPTEAYQMKKTEAPAHSWPFHTGVYSSSFGNIPICGGTLIAAQWVLTAAHCITIALQCKFAPVGEPFSYADITGHRMAVRVGAHDYSQAEPGAYNVEVDRIIMHPNTTLYTVVPHSDIALLKLKRKIKSKKTVHFACLPKPGLNLDLGTFCYVAGWGLIRDPPSFLHPNPPKVLMEMRVPIAVSDACRKQHPDQLMNDILCTNNMFGIPCPGDSGGGLICFDSPSEWIIYGIVSGGIHDCSGKVTFYVKVEPKLNWIKSTIAAND